MKVLLVWIAVCCIWSTSWVCIELGLRNLPPLSFAAIRFTLALTILLLLFMVRRSPLPHTSRDWLLIGGTGLLFFAVNYGLVFWGQQYISAGLAAVLQATIPAYGLVLAHYHVPDERITWLKVGAVTLGVGGVAIIFMDQLQLAGHQALLGSVALVLSAGAVAYANVLVKAYGNHLHPMTLTTGQMFCGTIPLVLAGLMTEGNPLSFHWTAGAVAALLYLALVGSVTALLLFYWLLKRMDVTRVMLYAVVTPPLTMLLSVVFLGERLQWTTLLGAGCILASVGASLTRASPGKREAHPSPDVIA
jgi:drug/metabolite transporter (DMT)-like permease